MQNIIQISATIHCGRFFHLEMPHFSTAVTVDSPEISAGSVNLPQPS